MFGKMASEWRFAGYWADVIIQYGRLTGVNLDKVFTSTDDRQMVDKFCRRAMERGLTAAECARLIEEKGCGDPSVIV